MRGCGLKGGLDISGADFWVHRPTSPSRSRSFDRSGRVRIFIASDNPSPHNFELARRKAYTARTFRRPSLEWAQQTKDGADLAGQRQLADVIALGGGVPINVGNDTIGAVGVSGSSQTGDEACAKAGVAKVAEQLKTN